jgi:hypothetical protein
VPIVWSGGCSANSAASDWNAYCLDATDFSTASQHLTIGQTSITIVKAGFYRVNFWTISHGPTPGAVRFLRNGSSFHHGVGPGNGSGDWQWRNTSADVIWPFQAGDALAVEVWNPGTHAFASWSPSGAYSRLQVQYIGPTQ